MPLRHPLLVDRKYHSLRSDGPRRNFGRIEISEREVLHEYNLARIATFAIRYGCGSSTTIRTFMQRRRRQVNPSSFAQDFPKGSFFF
jgi:hypothetical protein